jgi:hypothetical protein
VIGVLVFAGLTAYDTQRIKDGYLACLPDVIPGPKCESGYFRSLSRRFGHGTEGEVDGGDHRLLA